jgi:hypothetical protein
MCNLAGRAGINQRMLVLTQGVESHSAGGLHDRQPDSLTARGRLSHCLTQRAIILLMTLQGG